MPSSDVCEVLAPHVWSFGVALSSRLGDILTYKQYVKAAIMLLVMELHKNTFFFFVCDGLIFFDWLGEKEENPVFGV